MKDLNLMHKIEKLAKNYKINHPSIDSTLIHGFGECKDINNAMRIYENAIKKNIVIHTAMIQAFANNEKYKESLQLFHNILPLCKQNLSSANLAYVAALIVSYMLYEHYL